MSDRGKQGRPRASAVMAEGLFAGTSVATPAGWRPVETLEEGDAVLTLGGRVRRLTQVRPSRIEPAFWPATLAPLLAPPGALGNRVPLVLLSGQRVMLATGPAGDHAGGPFALVPAAALDGYRGIVRVPPPAEAVAVTCAFAQAEVILAAGMACLACGGTESRENPVASLLAPDQPPALNMEQAAELVARLVAEEAAAVLRAA